MTPIKLRVLVSGLLAMALSACAANRLQVIQSNEYTVTLQYNSVATNYKKVVAMAEAEAAKRGKQAVVRDVIDQRRKTQWGAINTIVFDLK